jgi:hypothetical protein
MRAALPVTVRIVFESVVLSRLTSPILSPPLCFVLSLCFGRRKVGQVVESDTAPCQMSAGPEQVGTGGASRGARLLRPIAQALLVPFRGRCPAHSHRAGGSPLGPLHRTRAPTLKAGPQERAVPAGLGLGAPATRLMNRLKPRL